MPRPGPRRGLVAIRLDDDALAWIDQQAEQEGVTRSDVIRAALAAYRKKRR
jgi:predicted transcriptional regulator